MPANPDYRDLFRLLNDERVDYLLVGAHAVIFYAEPRYTKDLDVLVRPTPQNAERVWRALARFGAPLKGVTTSDFTDPAMIYQIGIEPNRIDVLMSIAGVDFDGVWDNRVETSYGDVPVQVIGRADLIRSKKASARPEDLFDVERLEDAGTAGE